MLGLLEGAGILGVIIFIILLLFVPLIVTILVGIGFANLLGFTGIFLVGVCYFVLFSYKYNFRRNRFINIIRGSHGIR